MISYTIINNGNDMLIYLLIMAIYMCNSIILNNFCVNFFLLFVDGEGELCTSISSSSLLWSIK